MSVPTCGIFSLRVLLWSHVTAGGKGLAIFCAELLLRGPRFISSPFLRRNEAHARAEAFMIARSLAGVFEHGMAAGPVPARAHLPSLPRRDYRCAASSTDHRLCVLYIFTCDRSF